MQAPTIRFATSTMSHFVFLLLLLMYTMHIEGDYPEIASFSQWNETRFRKFTEKDKITGLLRENLRPASSLFPTVLFVIMIYTLGMLRFSQSSNDIKIN